MSGGKIPLKVLFMLRLQKLTNKICIQYNHTVNRKLSDLFNIKTGPTNTPINGVTSADTLIYASRNLWFRLFSPTKPTVSAVRGGGSGGGRGKEVDNDVSTAVVLYFHGGGFSFLSPNTFVFDKLCRRIAREIRAPVVSVNYRLAPEYKYPCQYEDGFDALKFIDANFDDLNFPPGSDPEKCFIAGDSAGGNLAHHMAMKTAESTDRLKRLKIKGLILLQPFFGGEERTESEMRLGGSDNNIALPLSRTDWLWKAFLPEGSDRNHPAARVFGSSKAVKEIARVNFPATLVFVGGMDVLQDWQREYRDWLKKMGKKVDLIEYPDMFHGFYVFEELHESSLVIKEVKGFIQKQINDSSQ